MQAKSILVVGEFTKEEQDFVNHIKTQHPGINVIKKSRSDFAGLSLEDLQSELRVQDWIASIVVLLSVGHIDQDYRASLLPPGEFASFLTSLSEDQLQVVLCLNQEDLEDDEELLSFIEQETQASYKMRVNAKLPRQVNKNSIFKFNLEEMDTQQLIDIWDMQGDRIKFERSMLASTNQDQISLLTKLRDQYVREIRSLKQTNREINRQRRNLTNENIDLKNEKNNLELQVSDLEGQLQIAKDTLKRRVAELEKNYVEMKARLEQIIENQDLKIMNLQAQALAEKFRSKK